MKLRCYYIRFIILSLTIMLSACSGGPPEKPPLDSLTSPAKLLDQGISLYNNNNYPKAIHDFEKALLQYRSIDNQYGIASSCLNLAKTWMAINNNQTAVEYLSKANTIIKREKLNELNEHLHLLNSSLAIKNALYENALQELDSVLSSKNPQIKLAALKNRTNIAFLKNDNDKIQWLEKYKTQQNKNQKNTESHLARILRFEAELADDKNKKAALLTDSLSISQKLANRTAIAATLTQWANVDINNKNYKQAKDKILRALFIRHQLRDVKSSLYLLQRLQLIYAATNNKKETLTKSWIEKISNHDLENWQQLFTYFDTYPELESALH